MPKGHEFMMKKITGIFFSLLCIGAFADNRGVALTDAQVRKQIVQESIESYPGNCPCPYNRARNGSRCGGRSAWSRAGGYSPVCYEKEVTPEMIAEWRRSRRQ
ncbi:hypothetical protein LJC19_05035 [Oxalobacter sp. OttesenSCG-928-P03]|nr:hypothetical protein [Oxalobacter sp. OttesenSCG-928-P03]